MIDPAGMLNTAPNPTGYYPTAPAAFGDAPAPPVNRWDPSATAPASSAGTPAPEPAAAPADPLDQCGPDPAPEPADPPADPDCITVALDQPIIRGPMRYDALTVRRPRMRALMGVNLADLLQLRVDALRLVLPRITEPPLTARELDELDPADLVQLATAAAGFFVRRSDRTDAT